MTQISSKCVDGKCRYHWVARAESCSVQILNLLINLELSHWTLLAVLAAKNDV